MPAPALGASPGTTLPARRSENGSAPMSDLRPPGRIPSALHTADQSAPGHVFAPEAAGPSAPARHHADVLRPGNRHGTADATWHTPQGALHSKPAGRPPATATGSVPVSRDTSRGPVPPPHSPAMPAARDPA